MKLKRFRVKDFRSIIDTGWIECQNVTAFAGENESGKTTLLMALLKLTNVGRKDDDTAVFKSNEVEMATIDLEKDMPIDRKDELEHRIMDTEFIFAEFFMTEDINAGLKRILTGYNNADSIVVSRKYSGDYEVDILSGYDAAETALAKSYIINRLPRFMYYKEVHEVDSKIDFIGLALKLNGSVADRNLTANETIVSNLLDCLDIWESNLVKSIVQVHDRFCIDTQDEVDFRKIFEAIPFLKERIERGFHTLNREFRKWWGRDDATITFEPYNRGVMIKVIDQSGKSYMLEHRSTGFRRFFALFLSFSISGSRKEYENSILLFDEAGAALHPIIQRKLAEFFHHLGEHAQLFYNTHTAYMLDVAHLNRIRVVYKDATRHTRISETLKVNEERSNELSLFPVQSSLAMYIAEKAMAGCLPIVVLNEYDEYYLSIIKNILSANGKLATVHNILIFATGENGIDAATEAFSSGDDYPIVLLASDPQGMAVRDRLIKGKYAKFQHKVLSIGDYARDAVIFEDLIPGGFVEIFSKVYLANLLGEEFSYDRRKEGLIKQVEDFAAMKGITLPANYRSELARRMKINTMMHFKDVHIPLKYMNEWIKLWKALLR